MSRLAPGRARVRLSGGGFWSRGEAGPPPTLAVEILAQAAAELLGAEEGVVPGFLAGVEEAVWAGEPPAAGDELSVTVRLEARLGPVAKLHGSLVRDGREVFTARLVVREQ